MNEHEILKIDMGNSHGERVGLSVTVGRPESNHLRLHVLGRERDDAQDYWDGNWLRSLVEVHAGSFQGKYSAALRTDELSQFLKQLEVLYERVAGEAKLVATEGCLSILLKCDSRGEVSVSSEARDEASGAIITLSGVMDQTCVGGIIKEIREVLREYPIRGKVSG